jgi:lipoprotein-releasing system permease protein
MWRVYQYNFLKIADIDDKMVDGELLLQDKDVNFAVVGGGIAYSLSLVLNDPFNQLSIYVPKKGKPVSMLNPEEAFNINLIKPIGVFAIQQDFDTKYVLVPLRFAREIIDSPDKVTSLEIGLDPGTDEEAVGEQIKTAVGSGFKVETRLQQHEFLYRILKTEKWAVYFILSFILVIAIFNIIGSLTMLIIEKKKDIGILTALGAENKMIKNIFLLEGILITMSGALVGLTLGGIICFLQQQFGFIKLDNSESFLINAYPVEMQFMDFFYVLGIVFTIGFLAAWYASSKISGDEQVGLLKSTK